MVSEFDFDRVSLSYELRRSSEQLAGIWILLTMCSLSLG
ncbi:hypothetical protein LINGRAHAP2_LOCUS6955 [Linum grandiflorum]